MKLPSSMFRNSLLLCAVFVLTVISTRVVAQTAKNSSAPSKPSATDGQAAQTQPKGNLKPLPPAEEGRERIEEGPDFLRRRQDWFFKPRAFPLGFIPQGARERALQQKKQMLEREGRLNLLVRPSLGFAAPGATTSPWLSIGPQATSTSLFNTPFTSGRVTALAVNPGNANNAYLGAAGGGLWGTTDGGTTWTPLTDFPASAAIPSVAVGSLIVDPASCTSGATGLCTTVYVGTGEDNFGGDNIYGEGVLKCTIAAGPPLSATCTQDSTFHTPSPLDETRGGPMIGALAINPTTSGNTAILLAGVRGRSTALQSGVYCSQDGGSHWTDVFGIPSIVGTDVAFAKDGTAFVALGFPFGDAANNGIYKSKAVVSTCVKDAAGTSPGGTGSNWVKQTLPAATPAASLGRITLAIAPSASTTGSTATVYAAIADATTTSSNFLALLKTTNGGGTWTQLTGAPAFCNSQCFYDMALAVDPADPNTVFAGGAASASVGGNGTTIARSTDGGTTWLDISRANFTDGVHVDTHAFAMDGTGGTLYVGDDGGMWKTTTPKGTVGANFWTNLNQSLSITQFYPGISIHPSTPVSGLGGAQDNDVQQYQGMPAWVSQEIGCDGGFTAINPQFPSTIYGECEYLPGIQFFPIIAVAFDGGQGLLGNTGFLANAGINNADRGLFITPLVIDEKTPQNIYWGSCRVWQSMDGGNTWNAISPDVTTPSHPAGCAVPTASGQPAGALSTIAVAPASSSVIYAGSDTGEVEVTSNGGTTWNSIAASAAQTSVLPTRSVTQVAVDPSSPTGDIAYVVFSGFGTCAGVPSVFSCDGKGHVFKTVNGTAGAGTTWVDISGTTAKLPDIPVNAIVIDPDDTAHNTLFIGTDIGAFFTTDGGVNWHPLGTANSLPEAEILGMALHEPSRTLRAATHGRGVWDLNLGGQTAFGITSIAPFTANAGSPSITNFTVDGNGFTSTSVVHFTVGATTTPLTTSCATANSCTATIPSAQLASGAAAQVTVLNGTTSTNPVVFTVLNPAPGITSISPTTVTAGTTGFVLTVNGSAFLSGTSVLFNGTFLPANTVTMNSPTKLTVQVPSSSIATPGTISVDTFNPQPGGGPDLNPTPPTLTVNAATFTVSSTTATITTAPGAAGTTSSGNSTITISAVQTVPVSVTCSTATPGVTCPTLSIPAGSTSGTLTVNVLNPSSTLTAINAPTDPVYLAGSPRNSGKGWWGLSAFTGFAAILLLVLPGRKSYRAAFALGLICVLSFTLGCSSGYGGGGGGTSATTTKISVTNAKAASGTSIAFNVTVTSAGTKTPTGSVQLYDGSSTVGTAGTLSSGSATINISTLAVGTHLISAHYLADAYSTASQSGSLYITVTGNTTVGITTTPAATPPASPVSLTIN